MLGAMRLRPVLVAIVTCLFVAACGGSSPGSSTQATATPAAAQTTTPTTTATTTPTQASSGQPSTTSTDETTTTTTNATAPPEVPKTKAHKHHRDGDSGGHGGASQGAHVESNVTVSANGDISPPVVSVPSGVGIELHITNHGGSPDTVALSVASHPSVKVAPGASGTLETGGLKEGTYRILVNGTPRGQLLIGAQGGP
jgi:hypothetical protein